MNFTQPWLLPSLGSRPGRHGGQVAGFIGVILTCGLLTPEAAQAPVVAPHPISAASAVVPAKTSTTVKVTKLGATMVLPAKGAFLAERKPLRRLGGDEMESEGEGSSNQPRSAIESFRSERDAELRSKSGQSLPAEVERSQIRSCQEARLESFLESRRESREETKVRLVALKQDLKSHRELLFEAQAEGRALSQIRTKGRKGAED